MHKLQKSNLYLSDRSKAQPCQTAQSTSSLDAWHGRGDNPAMTDRKRLTFYAAAITAALLNEIATVYGVEACTLLPLLLAVAFLGFWAFDVR